MESPFTDFIDTSYRRQTALAPGLPELEAHAPFTGQHESDAMDHVHESLVSGEVFDVQKAVRLNDYYGRQLGWALQLNAITEMLQKITGRRNGVLDGRSLAEAVHAWQGLNGFTGAGADGVIGPNTWKKMQPMLKAAPVAPVPVKNLSRWHKHITGTYPSPAIPLVHGTDTFKNMVAAIRRAENENDYIYILGWMVHADFEMIPGDPGSRLKLLLQNAAAKGVQVRALIWNNLLSIEEVNNAVAALNIYPNCAVLKDHETYGSAGLKFAITSMRGIISKFPFWMDYLDSWKKFRERLQIVQNEGSHHEKIIIVKAKNQLTAFCGGIDINPNRIGGTDAIGRSEVLHDVHCQVGGVAAWQLLQRFIFRWNIYKSEQKFAPLPVLFIPLRGEGERRPAAGVPGKAVPFVKVIHTYNHPSDKNIRDRSIRETVRVAIEQARNFIHIEDQYMISLEIASWINKKLRNGELQKVTILTQDDEFARPDIQFPQAMRQRFIDELKKGVREDVYRQKVELKMLEPFLPPDAHHKVHSKLYIIDEELAIIGSANLSSRSMTHDTETAVVLFNDPGDSPGFVAELKRMLDTDARKRTREYKANPHIKDWDEEIRHDLLNLPPYIRAIVGTLNASLIPALIGDLANRLKPAVIDVIDPDADHTQPQQEYAETENENLMYQTETIPEDSLLQETVTGAPAPDSSLSPHSPDPALRRLDTHLSPDKNRKATLFNQKQLEKSGIGISAIRNALDKYVHLPSIARLLSGSPDAYTIDGTGNSADAVVTEALHQFQRMLYLDPKEWDGMLGASTLDSLGFRAHGLRSRISTAGLYGQAQLNRKDLALLVASATGQVYSASNWFHFIMKPAWLGVKISDGVHALLVQKLRQAETWLLQQPQYKGMTPAELGRTLGFTASSRFSGARLSAAKQAMHGFGLAIDIHVPGNPWIGAGWIQHDKVLLQERYRMIDALRKASGDASLPGKTIFAYLHHIAQSAGGDSANAYRILKQRNDEFIRFLQRDPQELSYWRSSQTFGNRDPRQGFLNLHADLVYALRHIAGLAWGAIDFGPNASGDIMHFDLRTSGVGKIICEKIGGYVPKKGHPAVQHENLIPGETSDVNEEDFLSSYIFHEAGDENESGIANMDAYYQPEEETYYRNEDGLEQEDEIIQEEPEVLVTDWSKAIQSNRYYASRLGWQSYTDRINQLLLPLSGLTDVTLGDEAFARAVALWQQNNGFSDQDSDGIIGPNTWTRMQPFLSATTPAVEQPPAPTVSSGQIPSVQDVHAFNSWHARKILDLMDTGIVGQNFKSRSQLENIVAGNRVINLDPRRQIVQVLPVMYHIAEEARKENYREIVFGSFIRGADSKGNCTGHCAGRCIDINHIRNSFDAPDTTVMVIKIFTYLSSLAAPYRKRMGFGLPMQGEFFGSKKLVKFKSVPPTLLVHPRLTELVSRLGIVFPDNPNHLHIQLNWQPADLVQNEVVPFGYEGNPEEEAFGDTMQDSEYYSLAQRIRKVYNWRQLLLFKVPDDIVNALRSRKMYVQYAHNESYSNDLNVDFYQLRIDRFPKLNGVDMSPELLLKYIRLNINYLLDSSITFFKPYSSIIDVPVWMGANPRGAVLNLDIKGPDNAAVVCSVFTPLGWRFSTVTTPDTGKHPVSGHREFFITKDSEDGKYYFVVKGLDMMSTGIAGLGLPLLGEYGFGQADALWKSLRAGVIRFINNNGGSAREGITYSQRVEWRFVYREFRNALETTFGKGAGSAANSPFISFEEAET